MTSFRIQIHLKNISIPVALLLASSFFSMAYSQEKLTVDAAIKLLLKNNYSISISKDDAKIASNNATLGNAGAYPLIQLLAGENFQDNNIHQAYNTGTELTRTGVQSYITNANLAMTWTVFQGFKMYATYGRLKELDKIGADNLRMTIENNIAQLLNGYFDIVQQKQQMKAVNTNMAFYDEKLKIAKEKMDIGSSSKLDFLQAKVDLNAQKSRYLSLKITITAAKENLNVLLGRPSDADFDVEDTIIIAYKPNIEEVKKEAIEQNSQLAIADKNMQVANYIVKENESLLYPILYFTPGYNFANTKNQAGFTLLNRAAGFNVGGNLVYNIFNGSYATRNIQNARISSFSAKLNYDYVKLQVETSVAKTYEMLQSNLQLLNLEEENTSVVYENISVAMERFRLGSSSGIELRQAQQSLEDAQTRLISARYNTKLAETELLRLNGGLYRLLK